MTGATLLDLLNSHATDVCLLLLDVSIKGLLILAALGILALALRGKSAALRHLVGVTAALGLILLPVLTLALPPSGPPILSLRLTRTPVPASVPPVDGGRSESPPAEAGESFLPMEEPPPMPTPALRLGPVPESTSASAPSSPPAREPLPPEAPAPLGWSAWLCLVWIAGAGAVLARRLAGSAMIWRRARQARRITDGPWFHLLEELRARLGLRRRIALLRSDRLAMPLTCGMLRPVILVPSETDAWPEGRRRLLLTHELGHVKRWDCLTQWIAQLACAIHWFNPLVWLTARWIRIQREHACDDLVLRSGAKASDYADSVLETARSLRASVLARSTALAMARGSRLEHRMAAILDPRRDRRSLTRLGIAAAVVVLACAVLPFGMVRAAGFREEPVGEPPPDDDSRSEAVGRGSVLKRLMEAEEVGSDAALRQALAAKGFREGLEVPARLRGALREWEGLTLSGGPGVEGLSIWGFPAVAWRCDDGHASLTWSLTFRVPGEREQVRAKLVDRLQAAGLEDLRGQLDTHLDALYQRFAERDELDSRKVVTFGRRADGVREEVLAEILRADLPGARDEPFLNLRWTIAVPFSGPPATLELLLESCPLLRPPELEKGIESALRDAPVYAWGVTFGLPVRRSSFSGTFPLSVRPKLEGALARMGFGPRKPRDRGYGQITWERWVDTTFFHMIPLKDQGRLHIFPQPPQHPKAEFVAVYDLPFEQDFDRMFLQRCENAARGMAEANWSYVPWHTRTGESFRTWWSSAPSRGALPQYGSWPDRPAGQLLHAIWLGAGKDRRPPHTVYSVSMGAEYAPPGSGWGAKLSCRTAWDREEGTPPEAMGWEVWFAYFPDGERRSDAPILFFYPGTTRWSASYEFGGVKYELRTDVEPSEAGYAVFARQILEWTASPEAMRDTGFGWLDKLEQKIASDVRSGDAVKRAEKTARAGSPPSPTVWARPPVGPPEEPEPSDRPLSEEEKQQILGEAREQIDRQRRLLRENYREMHAALLKAFPLREALQAEE